MVRAYHGDNFDDVAPSPAAHGATGVPANVAGPPGLLGALAHGWRGCSTWFAAGWRTWTLGGLVLLGLAAMGYYLSWWRHGGRLATPWLAFALACAAFYNWFQVIGQWLLYLCARRRPAPPSRPAGLTVDVFVTACGEPLPLIERALSAAVVIRGAHRTWLLDDGAEPACERLAAQLGAGYLVRTGRKDAKAGNLNAALARTTGDVVAIFDIDHAPAPAFLERSIGYFADPAVGFVQVMLTFCNSAQSWVARAAAESTLDFYNPTSMGADGLGCATLIGSNALIRRTALESIGGYQPGLAEDLMTSLALHAAGWRSVYVAEPLAPGLAPPDLAAWFTQQLKWARGVFELLLIAYPRLFLRLTWRQRVVYGVRMTYYWIGPVAAVHIFFVAALLLAGSRVAQVNFHQYLIHLVPLGIMMVVIRQVALNFWRHPTTPQTPLWRATALVYATWPVYALAWLLAVLRVPLAFRPTPKVAGGQLNPLWLLPQLAALVVLSGGIVYSLTFAHESRPLLVLGFGLAQAVCHALLLRQAFSGARVAADSPQVGIEATR
ncbi:MAG: glycosyltransferase [Thermomicrobiales bacterium]